VAVFLVRVALADRPGALGAVASRIGAVRADVVGVEIVERAGGRAVDEFVVELADQTHMALLVSEIEQVDGAAVEQVRPLPRGRRDARRDAYEDAKALLTERSRQRLLAKAAELGRRELDAAWAAVVGGSGPSEAHAVASEGRPPAAPWLVSYLDETRTAQGRPPSPDIAWAELASWDLVLVVGRPGCPFARGEQLRLEALAGLADARWADLAHSGARSAHPTRVDFREAALQP